MRIAVLCGGGDAQGLNAAIQGIVIKATEYKYEVYGVLSGYKGLIEGNFKPLKLEDVEDIFRIGGTILKTSRTNPYKAPEDLKKVLKNIDKFKIDALIAIGGDDTLGAASKLFKDGVPVVGIPKTVDNDLLNTDYTIGFQTAVSIATEALDRLHTTAKSHERVIVCELYNRYTGWETLYGGLAGGAHIILLPEQSFDIESVCNIIKKRDAQGKKYTIVAISEAAKPKGVKNYVTVSSGVDQYGHVRHGGVGKFLANEIAKRTGKETRYVALGYVQRGGSPIAFDRILGLRFGIHAVELIKRRKFGCAASLKGINIVTKKLDDLVGKYKSVDKKLLELTNIFSGVLRD